jgi:predicted permease
MGINQIGYLIKQGWIGLKQKLGFVVSVVTTLGITLGALLCAVTLNYLLLVEPLTYPEQERIVVVDHRIVDAEKTTKKVAFSYAGLVHLYKSKEAFEQSAMMYFAQDVITSNEQQPLVNVTFTTPEIHQFLASSMAIGRVFEESEGLDSDNPVAILNYNTWQREFSGRKDILAHKITIGGVSYRIVGILAEKFVEPELYSIGRKTHVWLPWDFNHAASKDKESFTNITENYRYVGLLKEGFYKEQAQMLLTPIVSERWQQGVAHMDFFNNWSVQIEVRQLKDVVLGSSRSLSIMILIGVIGLALIACLNISNLFMGRIAEKQRQLAIQATLGATKRHLFKATFTEISILMFMSIFLALAVSQVGFNVMQRHLNTVLPRIAELSLNMVTFGVAIMLCVMLALIFSKLSTSLVNYSALTRSLQSSGKGSGIQVSKKYRQGLVASQIALATVLVFANVTLFKDSITKINSPVGFDTENLTTLILNFNAPQHPTQEEAIPIMADILERLGSLQQVESVAQGSTPLDGFSFKALTVNNEQFTPYRKMIDENYFSLLGQLLLQGDNLTITDRTDNSRSMLVNQAFANQLKADGDVIGMRLTSINEPEYKIIGIVEDINIPGETAIGSGDARVPRMYAPNSLSEQTFILKLKPGQDLSREQLAKTIGEVDKRYSVFDYIIASESLTKRLFVEITTAVTTTALAFLVLILAGIGIYGVLSYSTQMRRFELGTRMALGAKRKHLIGLILKDNAWVIIIGMATSIVVMLLLYIAYQEQLSSYISMELLVMFALTVCAIGLLSLFACYWPLRKYINHPAVHSLRGSD